MAGHEPLNQRIVMSYHLTPLARSELDAYLAHRSGGVGHFSRA